MNKKIKVIELINRIYENKNVPNRIIFTEMEFSFDIKSRDYRRENDGFMFFPFLTELMDWVHMEVEILEDEEEIDIQGIEEITYRSEPIKLGTTKRMCDNANDYMDAICMSLDTCGMKINKLVRIAKQLDKKINKEE